MNANISERCGGIKFIHGNRHGDELCMHRRRHLLIGPEVALPPPNGLTKSWQSTDPVAIRENLRKAFNVLKHTWEFAMQNGLA